jgi:hypothetical protein
MTYVQNVPLKNIYTISFPRSGQQLLQSILEYVFKNHDIEYSFCEYYNCCKSIPCRCGSIICKNHDFQNNYEILPDNKYIVLYREDKILQLESYYRNNVKRNNKEYDYDDLITFTKQNSLYYDNFKNKWVNNSNNNILKIEYYNLVNNTVECIKQIMFHLLPNVTIKPDIINKIPELEFSEYGKSDNRAHMGNNKIRILNTLSDEIYLKIKSDIISQ